MHLVSPSRVCGVHCVMPNGTPVAGNVWPSPAVPMSGLTLSAGLGSCPAKSADAARNILLMMTRLIGLAHKLPLGDLVPRSVSVTGTAHGALKVPTQRNLVQH